MQSIVLSSSIPSLREPAPILCALSASEPPRRQRWQRPARASDGSRASSPRPATRGDSQEDAQRERANLAMSRYAQGDDRAFEELYRVLSPRLYRLCLCLVGHTDAEELLQDVFLKMHRARDTFLDGGSVLAWSFAIARTTSVDRIRRRRRRPEETAAPEQLESNPTHVESCPEASCIGQSLERRLDEELGRMTDTLRTAYLMVKLEGLTCAEAGEVLGVSTSAVKQRVHRAGEELKQNLVEAGW